jgi:hypothetical protein
MVQTYLIDHALNIGRQYQKIITIILSVKGFIVQVWYRRGCCHLKTGHRSIHFQ